MKSFDQKIEEAKKKIRENPKSLTNRIIRENRKINESSARVVRLVPSQRGGGDEKKKV